MAFRSGIVTESLFLLAVTAVWTALGVPLFAHFDVRFWWFLLWVPSGPILAIVPMWILAAVMWLCERKSGRQPRQEDIK